MYIYTFMWSQLISCRVEFEIIYVSSFHDISWSMIGDLWTWARAWTAHGKAFQWGEPSTEPPQGAAACPGADGIWHTTSPSHRNTSKEMMTGGNMLEWFSFPCEFWTISSEANIFLSLFWDHRYCGDEFSDQAAWFWRARWWPVNPINHHPQSVWFGMKRSVLSGRCEIVHWVWWRKSKNSPAMGKIAAHHSNFARDFSQKHV